MNRCLLLFLLIHLFLRTSLAAEPGALTEARRLLLTGRYAEAESLFRQRFETDGPAAHLGAARCLLSTGKTDPAVQLLVAAANQFPKSATVAVELAHLKFQRGDHEAARHWVDKAFELDKKLPAAQWLQAELFRTSGKLDQAAAIYQSLVRLYNDSEQPLDTESLHWIGLAAAQHARWNRLSDQFRFLVNDFYPDLLRQEKQFWPAHLHAALLFAEKYNEGDAVAELNAALAINPRSAEIHAARAKLALGKFDLEGAKGSIDRALKVHPRSIDVLLVRADLEIIEARIADAVQTLEQVRLENPRDEFTLGRLAAAYLAIDGDDSSSKKSRWNQLTAEVVGRNEHCGEFYAALAGGLDLQRNYPLAVKYYVEARRRMPQLIHVAGELGLLQMRLGEEVEGGKLLQQAFEMDPFNVRVRNTLEVVDLLQTYAVLETEHFVLRFDRGRDEILARWAAKYLEEEVYPQITKQLGFQPPGKSLFEIFNRAKNTSGHGWFSARMVGLPFIGTVGACAGKVVAIASPNDMPKKYDWARVLRHEFVHVVNLQQTRFRIPHWFTEALAVQNEGGVRPPDWDRLLAARLRENSLFNLDTINFGFARPKSGDDWTLAYCQAAAYADYMVHAFGADATSKMLAAYAENATTRAALQRCFHVEVEAFEQGYRKFLEQRVAQVPDEDDVLQLLADLKARQSNPMEFGQVLERAAKQFPHELRFIKLQARKYLEDNDVSKLREQLQRLAELEVDNATYRKKLAQLAFDAGDWETAARWSRKALFVDVEDVAVWGWYAQSLAAQNQHAAADDAFQSALQLDAKNVSLRYAWAESLLALKRKDAAQAELKKILVDNPEYAAAKKLLERLSP